MTSVCVVGTLMALARVPPQVPSIAEGTVRCGASGHDHGKARPCAHRQGQRTLAEEEEQNAAVTLTPSVKDNSRTTAPLPSVESFPRQKAYAVQPANTVHRNFVSRHGGMFHAGADPPPTTPPAHTQGIWHAMTPTHCSQRTDALIWVATGHLNAFSFACQLPTGTVRSFEEVQSR